MLPHGHRCGHRAHVLLPIQFSVPKTLNWIAVNLGLYYSSFFPFWKHVFTQMSCKDFFSFYHLLDLSVDGSVAFNSNDIQSCANALQTCEKMSLLE